MSGIRIRALCKAYAERAVLDGVDLDVPDGALTVVLGPSGCGKTTLLRVLAGFETPDHGTVTLDGVTVDDANHHTPSEQRRIGYVPQEGALFPHLSVAANIAFGLGRPRRHQSRVAHLLELVGLTGLGSRRPDQLSGGQQQRVALARALAPEPSVVLLDEPFSALDAGLRSTVRSDVAALLRAAKVTTVLVTHDQNEALSLGDYVAVMLDGRIVQTDIPDQIYRRPIDPRVAAFVGEANLLPATLVDNIAVCALGRLTLTDAPSDGRGDGTVMVRPEQLHVARSGERSSANATVVSIDYYGHDAMVRMQLDAPPDRTLASSQEVIARTVGLATPSLGERVAVTVNEEITAWPQEQHTVRAQ